MDSIRFMDVFFLCLATCSSSSPLSHRLGSFLILTYTFNARVLLPHSRGKIYFKICFLGTSLAHAFLE